MADGSNKLSQTSTPSKVLHLRNLPYETTEEELRELCAPFGTLVQTKLNVGPNKNQAFVEFPEQNAAVNMIQYYTSTAEPAKVRGKTVYLQYSMRQEITNSRTQGDSPSNVLLVSLENLSPSVPITIETLHIVFSAFGTVQKIATFEKSAGFQALVQYSDMATADKVRVALDGRHIPRHLLGDTQTPPLLKITFSQHQDLNVKFQSHRSRDYTNPYLPVAPTGQDPNLAIQAPPVGAPGEGNVLLCAIENYAYPVVVDALHTVFSPYGFVQKIAIFEKNQTWQALIQFSDPSSAANAKHALEGHAVYDGGYNRLKISYSVHRDLNVKGNNERSWDFTNSSNLTYHPPPLMPPSYGVGNGVQQQYGQDYETAHIAIAKAVEAGGPPVRPPVVPGAFPAPPLYGAAAPYQQPSPAPAYGTAPAAAPRPAFPPPPNQALYQPNAAQSGYGHAAAQAQAYGQPTQGAPYYGHPPVSAPGGTMNQFGQASQQQQYTAPAGGGYPSGSAGGYGAGTGYPQSATSSGARPPAGAQPSQYPGQAAQYAPPTAYAAPQQYGSQAQYAPPTSQPQAQYPGATPSQQAANQQYAMY
eukprot:jgi/Botrbrau1/17051/Bobra.0258s0001.3